MAKKKQTQSVYLVLRKLTDPATGNPIAAFVASDKVDKQILQDRNLRIGDKVRASISKPRNEQFHRLVHALGAMLVDNIDDFKNLNAHSAIKKAQVDSQIYCCTEQIMFGDIKFIRFVPQSISFDSMDESTFQDFWKKICEFIAQKYWSGLTYDEFYSMTESYYGMF